MENKIIVKDHSQNRSTLAEAKSYQMGFAFLKKNNEQEYEAIHPMSCCKDYLNDLIFTLHSGVEIEAYGIKSKKEDSKYLQESFAYLGFKILPYVMTRTWQNNSIFVAYNATVLPEDKIRLKANFKNVEQLLHHVEERLNVKERTIIKEAEDDFYIAIVPTYWTKYQYLISLYALLIRMGQYYDGVLSPKEYLAKYEGPDSNLWKASKEKLEDIITKGLWKINYEKLGSAVQNCVIGNSNIHSAGINQVHHYLINYIDEYEAPEKPKQLEEANEPVTALLVPNELVGTTVNP